MTAVSGDEGQQVRSVGIMDTAPSPAPRSPATERPPRLGIGVIGITVRVVVAIALLAAANTAPALVVAAVAAIPGARQAVGGSAPGAFVLAAAMQLLVVGLVVVGVWGWMRGVERQPLRVTGWRWSARSLLWLLIGVVVAAGTVLAVTAVLSATETPIAAQAPIGDQSAAPAALLLVYYLGLAFVQQAIPEELLFRGWLLWRLRDRPALAVAVTTLTFTLIHLVSQGGQQSAGEHVAYLALPFGFALLAAGLLLWTGSLWAAVGVHGGFHVGTYLAEALLPQTDPVTSWLAIGATQALLGLVTVVTALRAGKGVLPGRD